MRVLGTVRYNTASPPHIAYLRSMADPEKRATLFDAKLVLVGEGGVDKTTLLKALTDQEPRAGELSTHSVNIDIQALRLPHPERADVSIQLNAWDFGGQEVYRVTHKFFNCLSLWRAQAMRAHAWLAHATGTTRIGLLYEQSQPKIPETIVFRPT